MSCPRSAKGWSQVSFAADVLRLATESTYGVLGRTQKLPNRGCGVQLALPCFSALQGAGVFSTEIIQPDPCPSVALRPPPIGGVRRQTDASDDHFVTV